MQLLKLLVASALLATSMAGFGCYPGCLKNADGSPWTVRVMFLDKQFVTSNPAAVAKVKSLGRSYVPASTCDKAETAVPECFEFENWNGGWVGGYMHQVLKDLGVNVITMTRANLTALAISKSGSSFTRCVWDVKYGNVDLCVGDFWETPERRNLTTFTTPIDSDSFSLWTLKNPLADTPPFEVQNFLAILFPFDNSVWMLCAVTIVLCTITLRLVEGPREAERKRAIFSNGYHGRTTKSMTINTVDEIAEGLWESVMAFFGGEDGFLETAGSWPGRIICVALGVFVFIHVNSYTGSLAAYYVKNNNIQLGLITSIADIKTLNGNLCLYESMVSATQSILAAAIPSSQMIQMDNYGPMLERLVQGACLGAIVGKFEKRTFISASNVNFEVCMDPSDVRHRSACANTSIKATEIRLNPNTCGNKCVYAQRYCNLVRVEDDTINSITLSWELPIRTDFEPYVSHAIMRLHTKGNLSYLQKREILEPNPILCAAPEPPSLSVGLNKLSGTFLLCGGFVAVGLVLHLALLSCAGVRHAMTRKPKGDASKSEGNGSTENGDADAEASEMNGHGGGSTVTSKLDELSKELDALLRKSKLL